MIRLRLIKLFSVYYLEFFYTLLFQDFKGIINCVFITKYLTKSILYEKKIHYFMLFNTYNDKLIKHLKKIHPN